MGQASGPGADGVTVLPGLFLRDLSQVLINF